jgi:hypothetical protein
MSDYEAKMSSEAKRVERYDREEKLLATPVDIPKGENDFSAKWNVFLRLPRPLPPTSGASSQPDMLTYASPQGGLFYYALLGVFPDQKIEPILERFKNPKSDSYRAETADNSLQSLGRYYTEEAPYLWIYPFSYSGGVIVVVFAPDMNKRKEADDAVRASLATLAFGTGATRAKQEYGKTHTRK